MKNETAPGYRPLQRLRIAQIPGYHFQIQFSKPFRIPDQRPHPVAPFDKLPRNVPSKEAGRSRNQSRLHRTTAGPYRAFPVPPVGLPHAVRGILPTARRRIGFKK